MASVMLQVTAKCQYLRCHGDNPWNFRSDVIVYETKIVLRFVNPVGNEKEWWTPHDCVVYKLNSIPNLSRISDWSVHSVSFVSIRLGPLRWLPTAHCAGRRGLNLPRLGQSNWPIGNRDKILRSSSICMTTFVCDVIHLVYFNGSVGK